MNRGTHKRPPEPRPSVADPRVHLLAAVLVTIEATMELAPLARVGRRLKGQTQTINLGADIFLADEANQYLGRICHYRECHDRAACHALHCGVREHLNDDLQVLTLSPTLIRIPPIELWPRIVTRNVVPADTEALLLSELAKDGAARDATPIPMVQS